MFSRSAQSLSNATAGPDDGDCTRYASLHPRAMQMQYHGRGRIAIPYLVTAGPCLGDGRAMRQTDGSGAVGRSVSSKDRSDALLTSPCLFQAAKRAATAAHVAPWHAGLCWYAPFCAVSRWRPAIFPGGGQVLGNVGSLDRSAGRASGQVDELRWRAGDENREHAACL